MEKLSGEKWPFKSTQVSDLDCIVIFYAGWIKAVLLFFAKLGFKLNELLRSS